MNYLQFIATMTVGKGKQQAEGRISIRSWCSPNNYCSLGGNNDSNYPDP
jgi:hypothetical protein